MSMKLEDLIEKFSAAVGIENVPAVEGVWKFSADGNVFGVTGDETGETVWLFGEVLPEAVTMFVIEAFLWLVLAFLIFGVCVWIYGVCHSLI